MKYSILKVLFMCVVLVLCTLRVAPLYAHAAESERFSNENWGTLPHPRIATFSMKSDGSAFGFTEDGISFVQYNVPNMYGIRVQRFEIQDHYHYIVDGTYVDSFTEFSALLAQVYKTFEGTV